MSLPFAPDESFHEYRFDWLADRISFYADGSWLVDMNVSIPDTAGAIFLNHWSNGDPNWSGGPPASDAVVTVSYVKAYFNTSDMSRNSQYTEACAGDVASKICQIPDQNVAPDPAGPNGNTTGHTYFFSQQSNMTVNQTLYPGASPGGPKGKSTRRMELSIPLIWTVSFTLLIIVMLM